MVPYPPPDVVLNLSGDSNPLTADLIYFRDRLVGAVCPLLALQRDSTPPDLDELFLAHIALAFRDIPKETFKDVLA